MPQYRAGNKLPYDWQLACLTTFPNMRANKKTTRDNYRGKWMVAGLACAAVSSLGFNAFQAVGLRDIREQISHVSNQVRQFQGGLAKVDQDYLNHLGVLKEEVEQVRAQAQTSVIGVKVAAQSALRKNSNRLAKLAKAMDQEREKLTADLWLAGCLAARSDVPRNLPGTLRVNDGKDPITTDGALVMLRLRRPCDARRAR